MHVFVVSHRQANSGCAISTKRRSCAKDTTISLESGLSHNLRTCQAMKLNKRKVKNCRLLYAGKQDLRNSSCKDSMVKNTGTEGVVPNNQVVSVSLALLEAMQLLVDFLQLSQV